MAESLGQRSGLPKAPEAALRPSIAGARGLTEQIRALDRQVEEIARTKYPQMEWFRSVPGGRSASGGLVPRQDPSGKDVPQLPITKAGDGWLRRLLMGCAHYVLDPSAPRCGVREFGLRLATRGGRNPQRRVVVAVAPKLAAFFPCIVGHKTWYDPKRGWSGTFPPARAEEAALRGGVRGKGESDPDRKQRALLANESRNDPIARPVRDGQSAAGDRKLEP